MTEPVTSTLADFGACLLSAEPRVLDLPEAFPLPPDPVAWAHGVASAHPRDLRIEAMPRTVGLQVEDPTKAVALARDADPQLIHNALNGIARGAAAHAAMELWHKDSFGERVADPAVEPFKAFLADALGERLGALHPVGYHKKLTMWFSADAHIYDAHCDVADGFLFQLRGEKVVEVWPVPDGRGEEVLFDHRYRYEPSAERGRRFRIAAGQALFIPAGAMHEVTVGSGNVSVSMSLHTGSPFPLIELCRDLNHLSGLGEPFGLPERLRQREKFHVVYFDPPMFREDIGGARMPARLRDAVLDVVTRPAEVSRGQLGELLDAWWHRASARPCYPGPDVPPEGVYETGIAAC